MQMRWRGPPTSGLAVRQTGVCEGRNCQSRRGNTRQRQSLVGPGIERTVVTTCVARLMEDGFAGIMLVAANPVDVMAHVAFRTAGLPADHVIGTGTLLDLSRLRQAPAAQPNVAPTSIEGLVLGEHGDSEVAAFSTVRVGGETLFHFLHPRMPRDVSDVVAEVHDAGCRNVSGKGYSSFGIATAIVRISEAMIRSERVVPAASTLLTR